ncbi:MAG: PAS domain S-box protein [Bacteroidota bacterium]
MSEVEKYTASESANAFIVRMMNELNTNSSADAICNLIGSNLNSYLGKFISITDYRRSDDSLGLQSIWGLQKFIGKIASTAGFDPLKKRYCYETLDEKYKQLFTGNNLVRLHDGIYDFALGQLPKMVANTIQSILGIKYIYTIGFFWDERHYGGVSVFSENELSAEEIFVIESLTKQVSVLLSRIMFDKYFMESEMKYRQLFQAEPDAIFIFDRESQLVIDVNDAACALYGYSRDEFIGLPVIRISSSPSSAISLLSKMKTGEKMNLLRRKNIRKDGSEFIIDAVATMYELDGKEVLCFSVRDITEIISTEKKMTDNIRSLTIISWITNSLNECDTVKDILKTLGTGLFELAPDIVFIVSEIDHATGYSTIHKTVGPGWVLKAASKFLNIESKEYKVRLEDLRPEDQKKLKSGKIEEVEGGIYQFSVRKIMQPLAVALEKILGVNKIHAIGLNLDNEYYGGITMLSKREINREEMNIMEMLVRQATVHISKIVQKRAIIESEERFRSLVENAPVAVFVQTDEKFAYLNKATLALFEADSPDALMNTCIYDRFHSDFREIVCERIKLLNNEKKNVRELEEVCLKMDGSSFDVYVSAVPVVFGGKNGAMFTVDSLRAVKDILKAEMALEVIPGNNPARSRRIEVQQLCRNKSTVWVESHVSFIRDTEGKPVGFLGVTRSIMERKLAEEALSQSEELYRTLVHVSPDIIVIADLNGIISFVSPRAKEMMRQSNTEGVGQSLLDWLMPEYHALASENIKKTFTGEMPLSNIYKLKRADNTTFWGEINGAPLYDNAGRPKALVAVVRNVTRRVEAEERIRNINMELEAKVRERTAKLEILASDLESFSYSVSHDLRTPLRSLDGFANMLLDDYSERIDDEGKRMLNKIIGNAHTMGTLIDDLLEFSQIGRKEIRLKQVDMKKIVHQVYGEILTPALIEKTTMTVGELPFAYGDEKLLKQVFVNLISNAVKYSSKKEKIEIEVGGYAEKGEIIYFVSDKGVGFDMQYIDKLFTVFQRLHRATEFEGTGVGLAIVKQIISRHGGRVWARAEKDKGAEFYFSLPKHDAVHEV